jgi:hypothetical protein
MPLSLPVLLGAGVFVLRERQVQLAGLDQGFAARLANAALRAKG